MEKIHAQLFKKAIDTLEKKELVDIFVCSVCGYTVEGEPPDKCPVCNALKKLFKKLDSILRKLAGAGFPAPIIHSGRGGPPPRSRNSKLKGNLMRKLFRCRICGDPYLGSAPPSFCPFCGAPQRYMVPAEEYVDRNDVPNSAPGPGKTWKRH